METFALNFPNNRAVAVHASSPPDGPSLMKALNLPPPRAVLLLHGGASDMSPSASSRVRHLVEAIARIVVKEHIAVIDGGTCTGVMKMMGEAYDAVGGRSPLIGVCPAALVTWPGGPASPELVSLELNHTHFVLTPGSHWGDETETMFALASTLAADIPSLAILINGGSVARRELLFNVRQGREIIIVEGSGRLADVVAGATKGIIAPPDEEMAAVVREGQLTLFRIEQGPDALARLIYQKLFGGIRR